MKNIYCIGLGLIGGSMAIDLKVLFPEATINGIDVNEAHLEQAFQLKIIDQIATFEQISKADLVIVAVPVDISLSIVPQVLDLISDTAIVFDVGSTKTLICETLTNHPKRRNFIATHPIAGTEFSGPAAAKKGLFENKTNIICEVEKTAFKLQEQVLDIFKKLGMNIRYMEPKSHDKHIAYMSHLSHISSFMLGKTIIDKEKDEQDIFDMAGSGFESTVRLAKSSPAMWTPILKQNKKHIIKSLEEYINNLTLFKTHLINDDYQAVFNEMQNVNKIKDILAVSGRQ
jgi:prephenate dehydrogenase